MNKCPHCGAEDSSECFYRKPMAGDTVPPRAQRCYERQIAQLQELNKNQASNIEVLYNQKEELQQKLADRPLGDAEFVLQQENEKLQGRCKSLERLAEENAETIADLTARNSKFRGDIIQLEESESEEMYDLKERVKELEAVLIRAEKNLMLVGEKTDEWSDIITEAKQHIINQEETIQSLRKELEEARGEAQ